jgi:hypothetical protein
MNLKNAHNNYFVSLNRKNSYLSTIVKRCYHWMTLTVFRVLEADGYKFMVIMEQSHDRIINIYIPHSDCIIHLKIHTMTEKKIYIQ